MASKCFYLITYSVLFIFSIFLGQVSSHLGDYYIADETEDDVTVNFVQLVHLEKRETTDPLSVRPGKQFPPAFSSKPDVPSEEKSQKTKKPLDLKPTSATSPDGKDGKTQLKKDSRINISSSVTPVAPSTESHEASLELGRNHDHSIEHDLVHPYVPSSSEATSTTDAQPTAKTKIKASGPVLTNITIPDPEIQISKFFDMDLNATLKQHNITKQREDHHLYYNSSFLVDPEVGQKYWVDIDKHKDVKVSDILSQSHRRAVTVKLSFDFPFYGHLIRNITIATGGFLYTGEYVHAWLAATQYIAPLMANFDTSISNNSFVKYLDNGTAFTVQWENVVLQEKPNGGDFTFQCTLYQNGDIVFVYRHVAVIIEEIDDNQHPVKVGLSDAYIIDRTIFFVRRKTIYEYHRVQFNREDIKNWTVIKLNALDTCLDMKDCNTCLTQIPVFQCKWCDNRCSNGMDRYRQDWITKGCEKTKPKTLDECLIDDVDNSGHGRTSSFAQPSGDSEGSKSMPISGIMGILVTLSILVGISACLLYAYRNPHSPTGQFLIRYRPSQWTWRRGEARYTAATIHM